MSDDTADAIFHALADRTRRDIMNRVMRHEQSVSSLSEHYAMSFAAVQKHVAVLARAGLVTKQRRGREQIVHGNVDTLRTASVLLDAVEQIWVTRAHRIDDLLTESREE
jgi:DNA-binding transcriptional ArsR family regulator